MPISSLRLNPFLIRAPIQTLFPFQKLFLINLLRHLKAPRKERLKKLSSATRHFGVFLANSVPTFSPFSPMREEVMARLMASREEREQVFHFSGRLSDWQLFFLPIPTWTIYTRLHRAF